MGKSRRLKKKSLSHHETIEVSSIGYQLDENDRFDRNEFLKKVNHNSQGDPLKKAGAIRYFLEQTAYKNLLYGWHNNVSEIESPEISRRDAYELYTRLAEAYEESGKENKSDWGVWEQAAYAWKCAADIAAKANANETAKKLLKRSAEDIAKHFGPIPISGKENIPVWKYEKAGEYEKAARYAENVVNFHSKDWPGAYKFPNLLVIAAELNYLRAGKYKDAARISAKSNHFLQQIKSLKKAGEYREVLEVYDNLAKDNQIKPEYKQRFAKNAEKIREFMRRKGIKETRTLEDKASAVASIIAISGILGGLLFLAPNLTGNTVAGINSTVTNTSIGVVLFLIGALCAYFWVKKK